MLWMSARTVCAFRYPHKVGAIERRTSSDGVSNQDDGELMMLIKHKGKWKKKFVFQNCKVIFVTYLAVVVVGHTSHNHLHRRVVILVMEVPVNVGDTLLRSHLQRAKRVAVVNSSKRFVQK